MLIPVLCFTCGCSIGEKEDLFLHMQAKLAKKILDERKTAPIQAHIDPDIQITCGEILTKLGVKNDCCRKTMVTSMRFSDYY